MCILSRVWHVHGMCMAVLKLQAGIRRRRAREEVQRIFRHMHPMHVYTRVHRLMCMACIQVERIRRAEEAAAAEARAARLEAERLAREAARRTAGAIRIQRAARGRAARRFAARKRAAVVYVQSRWRGILQVTCMACSDVHPMHVCTCASG